MVTGNGNDNTSEKSLAINVDIAINVDSTAKSEPKESNKVSQGVISLSNLIASARRAPFKSTPGSGDKQTVTTTWSR